MTKKVRNPIVDDVVRVLRGLKRASVSLGISEQALWRWYTKGVPAGRVIQVEGLTGIPREKLRPDLFGAPRPRPRNRAAKHSHVAA